jgi:hypothetical protein
MADQGENASGPDTSPKETVENKVIFLDYATLQNKRLLNCKLVYTGGRPPILNDNEFVECEFIFEGPALNTANFMRALAHGVGKEFVLQMMLGIKP